MGKTLVLCKRVEAEGAQIARSWLMSLEQFEVAALMKLKQKTDGSSIKVVPSKKTDDTTTR